ncbi:MAG TPA: hypothetical protein VNT60_08210, partial [Deinococcales bacterium]|nr:hypothetical protein [Deinococcales bacterium]
MSPSIPTLDDLAGDWLRPEREEDFSLPAIVNFRGQVQATWGASGVQQWVCAPTGMATSTGLLFARQGERVRRVPADATEYRWRPYEIERRTALDGGSVHSRVRMPGGRAAVIERLSFHLDGERTFYLVFGGLARAWRFTDYWNLPPEDVPQMNAWFEGGAVWLDDTKTFGAARFLPCTPPASVRVFASLEDLIAGLEDVDPGRDGRGKLVALEYRVRDGDEISWIAEQGTDSSLLTSSATDLEGLWESGKSHWEETWQAAFTPGNPRFSGNLPAFSCGDPTLERLYYMSQLALLNSLREWPEPTHRDRYATGGQAIWAVDARPLRRAYVWGGTEGGTTTSFLWEVQLQAPLLALLDPEAFREQLEAFLLVDVHNHWGLESTTGRGAGMWYGVNDGAILGAAHDYLRTTGDLAWLDKEVSGRTVREHLIDAAEHWRRLDRDGMHLADYGAAQNILECVSTYEHRIAAFNAMNAWGMRQAAQWLAPERAADLEREAAAVSQAVRALRHPDGYYRCLQPDGEERAVRT